MSFVLTNDDGIDAPGIQAMRAALYQATGEIGTLIAPDTHLSGCSHQYTSRRAIAIQQRDESSYAIGGMPADCTRVAVCHLSPTVEMVLSGINAGGNLGADVHVSGTVAAVREAAMLRKPGIAVSQYIKNRQPVDWARATAMTARVLDTLLTKPLPDGAFWNVNLPYLDATDPEPDLVFCPACTQPLPTTFELLGNEFRYTGLYGDRDRDPGADVDVCFSGQVAITQIRLW